MKVVPLVCVALVVGAVEALTLSHVWAAMGWSAGSMWTADQSNSAFGTGSQRNAQTTAAHQVKTCSVVLPANAVDGSCGAAKGASTCGPLKASDSTYTKNAAGTILWQPFSALTPASPVMDCTTQLWSTLAAVGAKVPSVLPVVNFGDITGFTFEHSYDAGQTWDPIQTTLKYNPQPVAHCFRITALRTQGSSPGFVMCPF